MTHVEAFLSLAVVPLGCLVYLAWSVIRSRREDRRLAAWCAEHLREIDARTAERHQDRDS